MTGALLTSCCHSATMLMIGPSTFLEDEDVVDVNIRHLCLFQTHFVLSQCHSLSLLNVAFQLKGFNCS